MGNNIIKKGTFYAGGFFYNPQKKEVLLHKRDRKTKMNPGAWAFFGGLNEGGETPVQTFMREIAEELNIKISENKIVKLCSYFNEELKTYKHVFFVKSSLAKSHMHLAEGADFDWIPLNKVFEYNLTKKTKQDLKLFLEKIK